MITLCTYAQQGYAFSLISLCMCVYVTKNWLFEVLLLEISRWYNLLFIHRV